MQFKYILANVVGRRYRRKFHKIKQSTDKCARLYLKVAKPIQVG